MSSGFGGRNIRMSWARDILILNYLLGSIYGEIDRGALAGIDTRRRSSYRALRGMSAGSEAGLLAGWAANK